MTKILVTGGAKGVGAAIVRALAAAGHDVDFTFRSSADQAKALAQEIAASHPGRAITALPLDLSDKEALDAFCEAREGESRGSVSGRVETVGSSQDPDAPRGGTEAGDQQLGDEDRPQRAAFQKRVMRFCNGRGFAAGAWTDWDTSSPEWIARQFAASGSVSISS